jgi:hypothetical protein
MGRLFSFAEIVTGRDASVPVTDDNLLHAVPYAMVMTGKDRNNAGRDLRDLKEEIFHSTKFVERQLSTHGGPKTKLVSFEDAIELAMVLPGKIAKETRTKFKTIIHRYLAGDRSLIIEIQANAVSDLPIAQLARATAPNQDDCNEVGQKRRLNRDDMLFELEIAERRQVLEESKERTEMDKQRRIQLALDNQAKAQESYTRLCPNNVMDDRARLLFKDNMLNVAISHSRDSQKQLVAVENGVPIEDARPLTISAFAVEHNKHYDSQALQKIGTIMSNLYFKRHGVRASQHEQFTNGAVRQVRSYIRRDSDLLLEAFRLYDGSLQA